MITLAIALGFLVAALVLLKDIHKPLRCSRPPRAP
jgi:hypothetical protein